MLKCVLYILRTDEVQTIQVCKVDLELETFALETVELVPDTMELLTDTEMTQYYIQTWSLDYNDPGDKNIFSSSGTSVTIFSI